MENKALDAAQWSARVEEGGALRWLRSWIEAVELKNGRLAMIGFSSFFCGHFFPGTVPVMDMIGNH